MEFNSSDYMVRFWDLNYIKKKVKQCSLTMYNYLAFYT